MEKETTKHTPEPWQYRPKKHDDWGFIRSNNGSLVAVAKNSEISWVQEDEFRKEKKDPYEINGKRIVECVNAMAGIDDPKKWVEERKANMYKETLAKIDLDKFNFEGRCKQLEAENEKLKEILSELRYFSNLHLDHSLMKQIEDVVK
jgi:hypothetical protein